MSVIVHQPLRGILDRDLATAETNELSVKYSPYLQELVNYSTNLLARCEQSLGGIPGSPVSLIHLYYHAIQMTDGIEVLARSCCFASAIPLERSLLETALSIDFILQEDFANRSTAWLVASYLDRFAQINAAILSTPQNEQLLKKIAKDRFPDTSFFYRIDQSALQKQTDTLSGILSKTKFATIAALFKGKNKLTRWYQINDGPRNLEQMAERLGRTSEYVFLYKQASELAHACDSERMLQQVDGVGVITPLRPGTGMMESLYRSTSSLIVISSVLVAARLRPEEDVRGHLKEIMSRHRPEMLG